MSLTPLFSSQHDGRFASIAALTEFSAAYNVGSALMILLILLSIVGLYFYFRRKARLRHRLGLSDDTDAGSAEERVPLGAMPISLEDGRNSPRGKRYSTRKGKGKMRDSDGGNGRYTPPLGGGHGSERGSAEVVFALGDEEDEQQTRRHP